MTTLKVKFKSNIKGAIGERADCGNADTPTVQGIQSEELSDNELKDINEESSSDKKAENVPEKVIW